MPVILDQIPPRATRAGSPRAWLWLGALPLLLLGGLAAAWWFYSLRDTSLSAEFWERVFAFVALSWVVASFLRVVLFIGQHSAADGWDHAREQDLQQKTAAGRRSLQVLGVSLHTPFRAPDATSEDELETLLAGTAALASQPARSGAPARHSRLQAEPDATAELLLERMLGRVFADLAPVLQCLPEDQPLALNLSVEANVADDRFHQIWRRVWQASGIRQAVMPIEGNGLALVDHWLDHRVGDPAMLMVVSLQLAPAETEGMAESAVGLLFGNRRTQDVISPIAYFHRPEQQREATVEALRRAVLQALDWVPIDARSVEHFWRAGTDAQSDAPIAMVLGQLFGSTPVATCNLDTALGQAGHVAPWLAIAAATLATQRGGLPQFIFSAERSTDTRLWSTVVTSGPSLSK